MRISDIYVVTDTPNRDYTWIVQTPQAFSFSLIMKAYDKIINKLKTSDKNSMRINITDDAMVVEYTTNFPIRLIEGSYKNIKITTPEDIIIGNAFLGK